MCMNTCCLAFKFRSRRFDVAHAKSDREEAQRWPVCLIGRADNGHEFAEHTVDSSCLEPASCKSDRNDKPPAARLKAATRKECPIDPIRLLRDELSAQLGQAKHLRIGSFDELRANEIRLRPIDEVAKLAAACFGFLGEL